MSLNHIEPTTEIGKAMRQLYDRYGAAEVLTNEKILLNGLGDLARDNYTLKLRSQLSLAMDAGLGRAYLEQLEKGKPDDDFDQKIYMLLTQDAGLNDAIVKEISGYFNEMMGLGEASDSGNDFDSDSVYGYKSAFQQILYYDDQGRLTDKEHAYKIVTRSLGENGNVINEIIRYVDKGEYDNVEKNKKSKKTRIIVAVVIIAVVLLITFIIIKLIPNNTEVPQQANTFTVEYLEEDGKYIFDTFNTQLKTLNEDLTLITDIPAKEGYTFVEWNTKLDGSGVSYLPGDTYRLNQPLVLYAQWQETDKSEEKEQISDEYISESRQLLMYYIDGWNDLGINYKKDDINNIIKKLESFGWIYKPGNSETYYFEYEDLPEYMITVIVQPHIAIQRERIIILEWKGNGIAASFSDNQKALKDIVPDCIINTLGIKTLNNIISPYDITKILPYGNWITDKDFWKFYDNSDHYRDGIYIRKNNDRIDIESSKSTEPRIDYIELRLNVE